jgi:hypothetical protein
MLDLLEKYNTIECWTLLVAIATLVVAIITLCYTRYRDKKHLKSLIRRKKAQLHSMEMSMKAGFNVSEIGSLDCKIAAIKADIEQLEEEL